MRVDVDGLVREAPGRPDRRELRVLPWAPVHGHLEDVAVALVEQPVVGAGEVGADVRAVHGLLDREPGTPRGPSTGAAHLQAVAADPRFHLRGVAVDLDRRRAGAGHRVVGLARRAERAHGVVDLVVADQPVAALAPGEGRHAVVPSRRDNAVVHQRAGRGDAPVLEALGQVEAHHVVGQVGHRSDRPIAAVVRSHPGRADGERPAREETLERPAQGGERRRGQSGAPQERPPIDNSHGETPPSTSVNDRASIA